MPTYPGRSGSPPSEQPAPAALSVTMTLFDLHGFRFDLNDENDALSAIADMYKWFAEGEGSADASSDLSLTHLENDVSHEYVLGGAQRMFGRAEDRFTVRDYASKLAISPDWSSLSCSPQASTSTLMNLIEGELRRRLAGEGKIMLHASGVRYEGETIVFPAWRYTGKTNTMLSFVSRRADFLGDDAVLVDADGTAYAYPVPIHVLQYNLRGFPTLFDRTRFEQVKDLLHLRIANQTEEMPQYSFVRGVLDYVNHHFIKETYWGHPPDLFDGISIPESTAADKVVLLETTETLTDDCRLEPIDAGPFTRALRSIGEYEYNSTLLRTYGAFDMLFPDRDSRLDALDRLQEQEQAIQSSFAECVDTYRLLVPEEDNWSRDIQDRIVETVATA